MKKEEFNSILDKYLNGKSREEKVAELEEIVSGDYVRKYLVELTKGLEKCESCGKFFELKETKKSSEVVEEVDSLHDEFGSYGSVISSYSYLYLICPHCAAKKFERKIFLEYLRAFDKSGKEVPLDTFV